MCLILLALDQHRDYPFVLAANRDEFRARPTRAAQWWPEAPELLAGRDLEAGGTWLGLSHAGHFAAVTNFRDGRDTRSYPCSRGALVRDFLIGDESPEAFVSTLGEQDHETGGFNLLLGAGDQFICHSNRGPTEFLGPGVYGLSNHLLNTPWPKVAQGRSELVRALSSAPEPEHLLQLLRDDRRAAVDQLPDTGVGERLESLLSSRFIAGDEYGTRSSTVVIARSDGRCELVEQSFDRDGAVAPPRRFVFQLQIPLAATPGA